MFLNKKLIYKGTSVKRYNEIINILMLNNIKYIDKIKNKNKDLGPMVDKMIVGTLGQNENFSYEYSVFVSKNDYEHANFLLNSKETTKP
ncbi:hypothetical protein [Intestinibacter sp.]